MDTRWSSTTKLIILIIVLIFSAAVLVRLEQAILPLLLAFVLAYLLKPAADWLMRRTGWPRGFAIIVIYLIILFLLILMPLAVTPSLISAISSINIDIESLNPLESLNSDVLVLGPIVLNLGEVLQQSLQGLQSFITPFASGAVQVVAGVATSLFWIVFVFVVVFWLIKDSYKLEGWIVSHIPPAYQEEISLLLSELGMIWGSFFRGELVLAITVGFMVWISMAVLGINNALLLAIIAGLMEFIPTIGPVIAAIPAIFIAWFTGSSWLPLSHFVVVLLVILVYTFIFQLEQLYLLPRIVGRRVRLHPGVVFVGTIIAAVEFGVLGVLLAAPVIASVRLFGNYVYRKMLDLEPFSTLPGSDPVAIEWRGMIRGQPITAIFFDLDGTIIDTDDDMIEHVADNMGHLRRIFPGRNPRPFLRHLLMLGEGPINRALTTFDRLDIDDDLFRLNDWIRRALGLSRSDTMALIPGVVSTLDELKKSYRLAIVTTRGRTVVDRFLEDSALEHMFEVVITRDDVRRLKPHPEPVLRAVELMGLEAEQCVMIGDTSADVLAARAAEVHVIAVLSGFGQTQNLEDADIILETTSELTDWL